MGGWRWIAALLGAAVAASAQTANTGSITGRVLNPATRQYVANAEVRVAGTNIADYTKDDGSYLLTHVPAGTVTLNVDYTGYQDIAASVTVAPGATATRDFELQPTAEQKGGDVIKLDEVVVSTTVQGNAKAIMTQRANINATEVVAADNFGNVATANVGEFLRYLPGLSLDYTESSPRAARIVGLDPKYVKVTLDGAPLASAASASFSGSSRQFEFEQASINSISSIEVNRTLKASLPADAPAGNINMVSKNAFEASGRSIDFNLFAQANSLDLTLGKTVGPDDGHHYKVFPGFILNYSDVFAKNRFGFQVTLSDNTVYTEQNRNSINYSYSAAGVPSITSITFRPGPKITRGSDAAMNFDYKVRPELVVSFRSSFNHFNDEYVNRSFQLNTKTIDLDPTSTLTTVIANADGTNTNLGVGGEQHRLKLIDTYLLRPKLTYTHDWLMVSLAGSYSRSTNEYVDTENGFFSDAGERLTRMSWMASRPDTQSTAWTITQLSGRPWNKVANFNADDPLTNNIGSSWNRSSNQYYTGNLDSTQDTTIASLPVKFSEGVGVQLDTFSGHSFPSNNWMTWTYVGPTGSGATSPLIPETNFHFTNNLGGNLGAQNWPYPNRTAMYDLYVAHPGYFVANAYQNEANFVLSPRTVQEEVNSGYVMADTRWNKLRANFGLRYEHTVDMPLSFDPLPAAQVPTTLTKGTIPYLLYQYRNLQRVKSYHKYQNTFASGGLKYDITHNLVASLSGSQSLLRPDYSNLAGVVSINDTAPGGPTITIPNPTMKPERDAMFVAGLDYYIEPAGRLGVSAFRFNQRDMQAGNKLVDASALSAAGINPADYPGYLIQQPQNAVGEHHISGISISYDQSLTHLPRPLNGFSLHGTFTRIHADTMRQNQPPKVATGQVRYRHGPFMIYYGASWTAAKLTSSVNGGPGTSSPNTWQAEWLVQAVGAEYRLSSHFKLYVDLENLWDNKPFFYSNEPGRMSEVDDYGGKPWTIGIKGRF